ncbi:MAG: hypothetical protein ABSA68_16555 [Xanthobacteraceae bacterium]|jgi:hypothetical protein
MAQIDQCFAKTAQHLRFDQFPYAAGFRSKRCRRSILSRANLGGLNRRAQVPLLVLSARQHYSKNGEGEDNRGKDEYVDDRHNFLYFDSS